MTTGIVIDSDTEAHIDPYAKMAESVEGFLEWSARYAEKPPLRAFTVLTCTCPQDWIALSCPVHGAKA